MSEGNTAFAALSKETQVKLKDILKNFQADCFCEAYYNHECSRCRRLAKQGGGDVLLGEIVTGRFLFSFGLITDEKYKVEDQ